MNKKASILNLLAQEKAYITSRQMSLKYSLPSVPLSLATTLIQGKETEQVLVKDTTAGKAFKITPKGRAYVAGIDPSQIMTEQQMQNYTSKKIKGKSLPPMPANTITPQASSAIDGLTSLIEENQRLNAFIMGQYLQLKALVDPEPVAEKIDDQHEIEL